MATSWAAHCQGAVQGSSLRVLLQGIYIHHCRYVIQGVYFSKWRKEISPAYYSQGATRCLPDNGDDAPVCSAEDQQNASTHSASEEKSRTLKHKYRLCPSSWHQILPCKLPAQSGVPLSREPVTRHARLDTLCCVQRPWQQQHFPSERP